MNRRTFLQIILGSTAAVGFGLSGFFGFFKRPSKPLDREALIAQALNTPEGREALAKSMVEPIRRQLEYQAIGRKLFMVDELPLRCRS